LNSIISGFPPGTKNTRSGHPAAHSGFTFSTGTPSFFASATVGFSTDDFSLFLYPIAPLPDRILARVGGTPDGLVDEVVELRPLHDHRRAARAARPAMHDDAVRHEELIAAGVADGLDLVDTVSHDVTPR